MSMNTVTIPFAIYPPWPYPSESDMSTAKYIKKLILPIMNTAYIPS